MTNLEKRVARTAGFLYVRALKRMPADVVEALQAAIERESDDGARGVLETILENIAFAEKTDNLVCQDTGTVIVFARLGDKFPLAPRFVEAAIGEGVGRATLENDIRPNLLHPLTREPIGNNVGRGAPVVHFEFVEGDGLELGVVPKGSGSENQSFLRMLSPSDGVAGVERFVLERMVEAGGMPCPPAIVGIGIGGSFDLAAVLAKRAIARPCGSRASDAAAAALEASLLESINALGLGPMGLGGDATALAVHVEIADTHISQLPVAMNIQCWAARRASAVVRPDQGGAR